MQEIELNQQGWKIAKIEFKQKQTNISVYQTANIIKQKRVTKT